MSSECISNSTIPPPPPVLPPPIAVPNEKQHHKPLVPTPRDLSMQNSKDDLLKAKLQIWQENCIEEPPLVSFYRHVDPILQEGPTCGLVALSMASACSRQPISVEELLHKAKARGFTNQGEIFSVDYMAKLAQEALKDCSCVEVLESGLTLDRERIIRKITNGSILLVPYDADKNHSPSTLRGHKAHWAVILGVLRSKKTCHLIARHGKSRHLGVWRYEDLQSSNENLQELDPTREEDGKTYQVQTRVHIVPLDVSSGRRGPMLAGHRAMIQNGRRPRFRTQDIFDATKAKLPECPDLSLSNSASKGVSRRHLPTVE